MDVPESNQVFSRGPWWRRLLRPRLIIILRGPVNFTDSLIFIDLHSLTRHEIYLMEWQKLKKQNRLKLVGTVRRPSEGG